VLTPGGNLQRLLQLPFVSIGTIGPPALRGHRRPPDRGQRLLRRPRPASRSGTWSATWPGRAGTRLDRPRPARAGPHTAATRTGIPGSPGPPRPRPPGQGPCLGLELPRLHSGRAGLGAELVSPGLRRDNAHIEQLEPEAGDSLHEPLQGTLIKQLGTHGGRAWADGDLAVVEFRLHHGTHLTEEGNLIRSCLAACSYSPGFDVGEHG
jgi:hypothetical protein